MIVVFGIPTFAMAIAILFFFAGTKYYCRDDEKNRDGSIINKTVKCICRAVSNKIRMKKVKKNHWLDYADDAYSLQMINDVKALLNISVVLLPVPFYWVLFDQQGNAALKSCFIIIVIP